MTSKLCLSGGKQLAAWLLVLSVMLFSSLALAEEPPARIAVVNLATLMEKSPQAQAASDKLKREYSPKEQELDTEKNAIKQAQDQLSAQVESGALNAPDQLQQERDLRSRERTYTRNMEDFRDELRTARDIAMDGVQSVILQAIEEVRTREGIDLVFKETDYVTASKRIDMTEKVLAYLIAQQAKSAPTSPKTP